MYIGIQRLLRVKTIHHSVDWIEETPKWKWKRTGIVKLKYITTFYLHTNYDSLLGFLLWSRYCVCECVFLRFPSALIRSVFVSSKSFSFAHLHSAQFSSSPTPFSFVAFASIKPTNAIINYLAKGNSISDWLNTNIFNSILCEIFIVYK